jgi:hypothetical protein
MREFDDNPHSYGPVLRRIAILAAVIIMVPVMLWTITSFMRTYVAQPVIASPKPLLAPATTTSFDNANAGASAASNSGNTPAQTGSITASGATANDSNPPSPAAKVAALATSDMPQPVSAGAAPQASTQPAATAASGAVGSPASSPWPDPSQAVGGQTVGAQMSTPDPQTVTATADDALPPTPPLTGKIPLPPHRPAVIAMATPGAGGPVPLPRARPSDTGAPAETTTDGGGNFLNHLFGQTH